MFVMRNVQCLGLACYCSVIALWSTAAVANDFPTLDRVRFVQECMALENSTKYETLYACSCMLDKMAAEISYDRFIEADSYMRMRNMRNMRGERGGLFRSSDERAQCSQALSWRQSAGGGQLFFPAIALAFGRRRQPGEGGQNAGITQVIGEF